MNQENDDLIIAQNDKIESLTEGIEILRELLNNILSNISTLTVSKRTKVDEVGKILAKKKDIRETYLSQLRVIMVKEILKSLNKASFWTEDPSVDESGRSAILYTLKTFILKKDLQDVVGPLFTKFKHWEKLNEK